MAVLFKCLFQGEPQFSGPVDGEVATAVARQAFPLNPAAHAVTDPRYSSFKVAPAGPDRVLLAVTRNRGDRDRFRRSVLTSTGCVLSLREMQGPMREVTTLWRILGRDDVGLSWDAFEAVARHESLCGSSRFDGLVSILSTQGAFHAQVAYGLVATPSTFYIPENASAAELLEPAFALLPLGWIGRVHFASGSTDTSGGEPAIAVEGLRREQKKPSSAWSFGGKREPAAIDLVRMQIHGLSGNPLASVAAAISNAAPWPGFDARSRYSMITQCLDSSVIAGRSLSPFDLAPNLETVRRGVRSAEAFAEAIADLQKNSGR